jgi:hypothetical protein
LALERPEPIQRWQLDIMVFVMITRSDSPMRAINPG